MKTDDFFDELGVLALGSRLKRLSDRLAAEANAIHQVYGRGSQARWFVLLALLHAKQQLSVVQAAECLGVTQPAISQACRELEAKGWLEVVVDDNDGRKRLMSLSRGGQRQVEVMQTMWQAVESAALDLCRDADVDLLQNIQQIERALTRKSLLARVEERLASE